ncbi:hypothetical protein VNO77_00996 [Canavalia gladiata]|uniref:Uncharacterized protein n=1 Tax=Canavalia gladiata TaxID=3824 RepID=A0AAN9MQF5_CANGL
MLPASHGLPIIISFFNFFTFLLFPHAAIECNFYAPRTFQILIISIGIILLLIVNTLYRCILSSNCLN